MKFIYLKVKFLIFVNLYEPMMESPGVPISVDGLAVKVDVILNMYMDTPRNYNKSGNYYYCFKSINYHPRYDVAF